MGHALFLTSTLSALATVITLAAPRTSSASHRDHGLSRHENALLAYVQAGVASGRITPREAALLDGQRARYEAKKSFALRAAYVPGHRVASLHRRLNKIHRLAVRLTNNDEVVRRMHHRHHRMPGPQMMPTQPEMRPMRFTPPAPLPRPAPSLLRPTPVQLRTW